MGCYQQLTHRSHEPLASHPATYIQTYGNTVISAIFWVQRLPHFQEICPTVLSETLELGSNLPTQKKMISAIEIQVGHIHGRLLCPKIRRRCQDPAPKRAR